MNYLVYILIMFLSESNQVAIELPALQERINKLLIVGVLILGLIMLLSLKIYQIENLEGGEENE